MVISKPSLTNHHYKYMILYIATPNVNIYKFSGIIMVRVVTRGASQHLSKNNPLLTCTIIHSSSP